MATLSLTTGKLWWSWLTEENLKLHAGVKACWTLTSPMAAGVGLGTEPHATKQPNTTAPKACRNPMNLSMVMVFQLHWG
jgi:hypothetical protein